MGGVKLTIVWPIETVCGIAYQDVFDKKMFSDINVKIVEIYDSLPLLQKMYRIREQLTDKICRKFISFIIRILNIFMKIYKRYRDFWMKFGKKCFEYDPPENKKIFWGSEEHAKYTKRVWGDLRKSLHNYSRIYIHAYCGIIMEEDERTEIDFSVIKFKNKYEREAKAILEKNNNIVGVHIRRTDHAVSIEHSSTQLFVNKMKEIIEKNNKIIFFLATDDKEEEKYLKGIFGDKIIVQENKKWGREDNGSMKSGIIDFLCLSGCDYILGSYTSVFSDFAAQYGNKKLMICKD